MMRLNLLRPLADAAGQPSGAPEPGSPEQGTGSAFKRALIALLLLLAAGAGALWLARPSWLPLDRAAALWNRDERAQADSLRRLEAAAAQASRLVDARQAAAIDWLYQLELLNPAPDSSARAAAPPAVVLTLATFTAAGEFLLAGMAVSAEALSALQETLVLVPGMDLRESRALEIAGSAGPAFDFRFTGRIEPVTPGDAPTDVADGAGSADSAAVLDTGRPAPLADTPARPRVVDSAGAVAHLDTLLRTGGEKGFTFLPPVAAPPSRTHALTARAWRLKGTYSTSAAAADASVHTALREFLERERFRASPFAVQRVTVEQQDDRKTVFLDILALTP